MEFPAGLFTDVRYESVYSTTISFENGQLKQNKTTLEKGAFIRVFDGKRWYYSATTDLDAVQEEIDALAAMAAPNAEIANHPVVRRLQANRDVCLRYQSSDISKIDNAEKVSLLESYLPVLQELDDVQMSAASYFDTHTEKHIVSSLGADVTFDYQRASVVLRCTFGCNGVPFSTQQNEYRDTFQAIGGLQDSFRKKLSEDWQYAHNAVPVVPGVYTCILAPIVAGVFAHESFGHKS